LSPDGRWLAYTSEESGQRQVYVRPFPDVDNGKWQVSAQGGENARWATDGRTLYFVAPMTLMAVPVEDGPSFRFGTPAPVLDIEDYLVAGRRTLAYDVEPGGQRFLIGKPVAAGNSVDRGDGAAEGGPHIVLVQNWQQELKRLVPSK
jgi:hypothetical protein